MIICLIIIIILILVGSLVFLFWDKIKEFKEKKRFSKDVGAKVYQLSLDNDFYLINKVALAIDTKVIHFDHLLFTNKYIYCIGIKYYSGPISGKFDDLQWFMYNKNNQLEHIKNPMSFTKVRLNYLKSALKANEDLFISVVLVNDSCIIDDTSSFPKNYYIMNLKKFNNFVKKNEKNDIPKIDEIQLDTLVQNIYKRSIKTLEKENKK